MQRPATDSLQAICSSGLTLFPDGGYDGEEQRIDTVHDQMALTHREIDGDEYNIWL